MNKANTLPTEMAADRFARRVTARLTSGTDDLPYDISERLRAARMQALAKRKVVVQVRRAAPCRSAFRQHGGARRWQRTQWLVECAGFGHPGNGPAGGTCGDQ